MRVAVKICGLTREADVEGLAAMGVQFLGFNFCPQSPRHITPARAGKLVRLAPGPVSVGVFADADAEDVLRIVDEVGLDMVQLHGNESADYAAAIPRPVIQAVPHQSLERYPGPDGASRGREQGGVAPARNVRYLLVDTRVALGDSARFGGTGESFDWGLLAGRRLPRPYFLAGGLGPENLARALEALDGSAGLFAVDLNSKVENAPGEKDLAKVRRCLEILRGEGREPS